MNEQYGFRSKDHVKLYWYCRMEHWIRIMDSGDDINVIYLDFQRPLTRYPISAYWLN